MSVFMMLDSSITAVHAERDAGFIIIVITTSCNHINNALTQQRMRSKLGQKTLLGKHWDDEVKLLG